VAAATARRVTVASARPSALPPTSWGAMSGVRTLTWKADYDLIDSLTKVRFFLLAPHAVSPVVSHPACSLSALVGWLLVVVVVVM
jgi:hypothetical protein